MIDILQAARSYYGLADTASCTTQLFTNQAGQTCVAFEIPLINEDFAAIVQRMQNMQQPDTQPDTEIIEGPTVDAMREAYNALSKAEKGRYGSFARYMTECSNGIVTEAPSPAIQAIMQRAIDSAEATKQMDAIDARQVVHVDTPEDADPVSMDAVWLPFQEASLAQMQFAVDTRPSEENGKDFLVQWAMLTDEQKQKAKP